MSEGWSSWDLRKAEVGSLACIAESDGWRASRYRLLRVTAAGKSKVTLEDGSAWTRRGRAWGDSDCDIWHRGATASLVLDEKRAREIVAEIDAERELDELQSKARYSSEGLWRHLTADEARGILRVFTAAKARQEKVAR